MEARRLAFDLTSSLGMELTPEAVVLRCLPGGQARRAGVREGWKVVGVQGQQLRSSRHLQDLLAHYKELNVREAAITFVPVETLKPKPRQPAKPPAKAPSAPSPASTGVCRSGSSSSSSTSSGGGSKGSARGEGGGGGGGKSGSGGAEALDIASWTPEMKRGVAAAGGWFVVKFVFGSVVHQWLSTVLAFGFCAVATSTVGFDPAIFFGGLATLIILLRLFTFFLGQGVHDCIVLGLIAASNTKPSRASFNGRPMREMQAAQAEIRQHQEATVAGQRRSDSKNFLERLLAKGREVVQDVVADVADAHITIEFYDYHFFLVAEAKISKTRSENVFYLGAFRRWFNLNTKFTQWALALEAHSQAANEMQT